MIRVLNGSSLENKGQPNEYPPNEVGYGMQQSALRVEGRAPFVQALLAKERMTNSGSAAMTIRSARAAASGWRRPDSQ
jgi:hypothetical protein